MFYSHEILTNRQYGVATIWLVATIGNKTGGKRVSKRAIQEVDVQRACEKIIEPGAPIALRLQGNLLYGVSRVYNQQCSYMLTDAHRIQSQMVTFFNQLSTNQLDPEAGKARRENIMILDDPDFFPIGPLPEPSPEMFVLSQHSNKTSSQMSPYSFLSGGVSSGAEGLSVHLGLRHSSLSDPHNSPRGLQGLSSTQKPGAIDGGEDIFGMNDMAGPIDWGMEIDADGNIIEHSEPGHPIFQDELELPPLPSIEREVNVEQLVEQSQLIEHGGLVMMEERPLPDAEALPKRQREGQPEHVASEKQEHQQQPLRRCRRKFILADEATEVSRNILRDWQHNYAQNCTVMKPHLTSATQAKRNAFLLTFGLGIANIGQELGIPGMIHPLAEQYSGDFLFTTYTGIEIPKKGRGKRVSSATEFVEDGEVEEQRKRPRLDAEDGAQGHDISLHDILTDREDAIQSAAEIGRDAQAALDDHRSSLMPWNRGSSLMPGSSMPGSANPSRNHPSSPLKIAGSFQDIVRYSDDAAMSGHDYDGLDFGSSDNHQSDVPPFGDLPLTPQKKSSSQKIREALDRESQNFLSFVEEMVHEHGELRRDEDFELQRKWIAFDDIFIPRKTDRITAAQAFYHILTLVTKGKMVVGQDGADDVPFGGIHVGIVSPRA